jgi:crotonobetainyl-CoA:carnitine CoA-transferase CaiB-like acyl-CoA transferase
MEFSVTATGAIRRPPALGEHSREVLGELGFSEQEVEAVSERCEQVRRDLLAGVGSGLWE